MICLIEDGKSYFINSLIKIGRHIFLPHGAPKTYVTPLGVAGLDTFCTEALLLVLKRPPFFAQEYNARLKMTY